MLTGRVMMGAIALSDGDSGRVVVAKRLPDGNVALGTGSYGPVGGIGALPFLRGLRAYGIGAFSNLGLWLDDKAPVHDELVPSAASGGPYRNADRIVSVRSLPVVERRIARRSLSILVRTAMVALVTQLLVVGLLRALSLPVPLHAPAFHALVVLVTMAGLALYGRLITRLLDIAAAFQHNAVLLRILAAEELHLDVTPATVRGQRSFHPFSAPAGIFLGWFVQMALAMVAVTLVPAAFADDVVGHATLIALKVATFPLVVSLTHELQRALSRLYAIAVLRGPLRGVLAFSFLWVREPADEQIELGCIAYRHLRDPLSERGAGRTP